MIEVPLSDRWTVASKSSESGHHAVLSRADTLANADRPSMPLCSTKVDRGLVV